MRTHWLAAVLGCLCLATQGQTAAFPSQDETLVVARSDDTTTEGIGFESDSTTSTPEVTTEEANPPIKLTEMDVHSEVTMRYAHTAVVTRVKNPAKRAQEATFRVLLPETAFITGFTMSLDGKTYKAYVKEKEEAKQIYSDAVSQGIGAAHIASKARDSNHFTVSVNVEPFKKAVFNLTYEELLVRRNNVYNHAVNLHPGAPVPRLRVTVHIKEAQRITALRVPEVRTGNEIDATELDPQNKNAEINRTHDDCEAIITFEPDLEEQRRLMEVYAEKAKETKSHKSHRYYRYGDEETEEKPDGILGQFVVQYDVDRPKDGEVLVSDGYFIHFFAPSSLPPLSKHVVFVLDTSGSMMDRKIVQLREAMQTILAEMNPGDYFNLVQFASFAKVFSLEEADKPDRPTSSYFNSKPVTLVPPSPATPDNIAKAKTIVSRLTAWGGTDIGSALNVAVDLIQKGIEGDKTPTTPADTDESPRTEGSKADKSADEAKIDKSKKLEPIIIFLTDGDPTVGDRDPSRIITRLSEKNFGEMKASIFTLAFGQDADRKFLRKLSLRNEGFMRHIYEAADAALQLRDFYRQVSSPLLADVTFVYPPEQVKKDSITKSKFRTFYAGSETVVAGRVADADAGAAVDFTPQVIARCGFDDGFSRTKYEIFPKVPTAKPRAGYLPLERLWAYLTVKQLLDERDATDAQDKSPDGPEKKALAIALQYSFVTPLTSLVVVKPNATNAVNAESVDNKARSSFGSSFGSTPHSRHTFGGGGSRGIYSSSARFAHPHSGGGSGGHSYALSSYPSSSRHRGSSGSSHSRGSGGSRGRGYSRSYTYALSSYPSSSRHHDSSGLSYRSGSGGSGSFSSGRNLWASHRFGYSSAVAPVATAQIIRLPSVRLSMPARTPTERGTATPPLTTPAPAPVSTSTPAPPAPVSTSIAPPAPAPSRLQALHLTDYTWVESLLAADSDALTLPPTSTNNQTVLLELTKDTAAPKEAADAPCARATDGAGGVCVYLTRCEAARNITASLYADTYCPVSNKYAGVCCPTTKVDVPSPSH